MRASYFLEVDRGTMPVKQANLRDSSIYKKLVIYYDAWRRKRHTELFGFRNFRVLFVTGRRERTDNMLVVSKRIAGGDGSRLSLFGEKDVVLDGNILGSPWTDGRGERLRLID